MQNCLKNKKKSSYFHPGKFNKENDSKFPYNKERNYLDWAGLRARILLPDCVSSEEPINASAHFFYGKTRPILSGRIPFSIENEK